VHYLYPEKLKVGDTIGLVTPSSPMMTGRLELGISYLERNGYKAKVGAHVHDTNRFMAGLDEDRAKDIMDFFLDPSVKAIMATGGGYSSQRILPLLDYDVIRKNPKWVIGFSDTTALQLGILSRAGIASCTGFTFRDLEENPLDSLIEKTLKSCLLGEAYQIEEGVPIIPGIVEGPLVGGNLGSLMALIGTPFQPNFKESILLIEEVWSEPYKIDSMFSQLELAGIFKQIKGLIFGQFERCAAEHFPERDGTSDDIINEWSERIGVPCIKEFPYGHRNRRCVLPIGKKVKLDAERAILYIF